MKNASSLIKLRAWYYMPLLILGLFGFAPPDEMVRPNVILIMSDDQGWGQAGFMDHPHLKEKTPNLDQMSRDGIRFERFYSAASVCSPTRASVMTGRIPGRTGVPGLHMRLVLQEKTLPQAMQKAGYKTAHFGKWHLGGVKGSAMPILPDDPNGPKYYGFDEWVSATNFIEMNPLMNKNGEIVYLEGESSILMVEQALDFAQRNKQQPFFIVLWYGSPHWPYTAQPSDLEGFSPEIGDKEASLYAEIRAMDRSIGMLKEGLKEMGELNNTLLWFCSDNGGRYEHDPYANGGLSGSKGQLLEGGIRVPGIIEWPDHIKEGFTTDFPATTMDIMPTLVDLLGLPKNSMLDVVDGESIAPLFKGMTPKRTKNIAIVSKGISVFNEKYKFISTGNGNNATMKLYDIQNDPTETTDISEQFPEIFEQFRKEADSVIASVDRSAEGKDYPEGKVLQPQRGAQWSDMPEYQALYDTFAKLKPGWSPPKEKTKRK